MTLALLFPGQGSQAVGMGAPLADAFQSARDVFAEVDEALGQKLSVLMREGPEDQLTLTENAQPALMAVSLAVIRVLKAEFGVDVSAAAFVACTSRSKCGVSLVAAEVSAPTGWVEKVTRGRFAGKTVIVTGAGKAFVAGGDIRAMASMSATDAYRFASAGHRLCASIEAAPFPVIAAVNGFAEAEKLGLGKVAQPLRVARGGIDARLGTGRFGLQIGRRVGGRIPGTAGEVASRGIAAP